MKLPDTYLKQMKYLLDNDYDSYINSFEQQKQNGIRTNTLKITKEQLQNILGFDTEYISWCDDGLYYDEKIRPGKSVYYKAGLFYIQEPSAMLTSSIINIKKNDKVLDLCAAPGGKSTHIAQKLNGTGVLVSNDISASRQKAVVKNIELLGIENCYITADQPSKLAEKLPKFFDKIIVDAPCSGEGMFRSNKEVLKNWTSDSSSYYSKIQEDILGNAANLLADGGEIIYSTCTFNTMENELVIKDFLDENQDFSIVAIDHLKLGIQNGISGKNVNDANMANAGRIFPHLSNGEGHFVALLKNNKSKKQINIENIINNSTNDIKQYTTFCENTFYKYPTGKYTTIGDGLYLLPATYIDLSGIRVLKSGLYLGELKQKRFEPSQAFAMTIKSEYAKNIINFDINDEKLRKYLNGESFLIDANDGYNVICVSGFALGFGKVINNRMKNKYSKSWLD